MSLSYITEEDKELMECIKAGYKRRYTLCGWELEGNIDIALFNEKYNNILLGNASLRRRLFYDVDSKLCAKIVPYEAAQLPTMDLSHENAVKQRAVILNVASAEARRVYHPDKDEIIRTKIFITGRNKIFVLMSVYSYIALPMSPYDMRVAIFSQMRVTAANEISVSEDEALDANKKLDPSNYEYWANTLKGFDSQIRIPFSNKNENNYGEFYSLKRELDFELCRKIKGYKDKTKASLVNLILREYGELFGEYSDTKLPLFAIKQPMAPMFFIPVVINLDMEVEDCYRDVARQVLGFKEHCRCDFTEAMQAAEINIRDSFSVVFDFSGLNANEVGDNENLGLTYTESGELTPRLEIAVFNIDDIVTIRYTYDSGIISEGVIDSIHDIFINLLTKRVEETEKFKWKYFLNDYKDQEEKLRKIEIAQKALYVQNADIIAGGVEDIIYGLAISGHVGNYIVEDEIISAGNSSDELGILVSGHVEERYIDSEGMIKTVSLYKPGYIFGIEALAGVSEMPFSYHAVDDVKIMWVSISILKESLKNNADSYEKLLLKAVTETIRVKKLWALE